MKNKLRKNTSLLTFGIVLACVITTIVEIQFKLIRRAYDHYILDNRNHYLSCNDLPTKLEVERILGSHGDVIQQIEQVAPGFVGVEIDSLTCEGKADLLIWYGTHQQRVAIEEIIGDVLFFGIPYRLRNQ